MPTLCANSARLSSSCVSNQANRLENVFILQL
jgi:hypothetical protein